MSKFIKYKDNIINVDNINYIDLEADSYKRILICFGQGRSVQFGKSDELVTLLNSLLEEKDIN